MRRILWPKTLGRKVSDELTHLDVLPVIESYIFTATKLLGARMCMRSQFRL
jgi:hypothetical protein